MWTSTGIALIALLVISLGRLLGSRLRQFLPEEHLKDDSKDVLKTASGMVATLVALVIGLLVSSAKSTYDQGAAGLTQVSTRTVLLDRQLQLCGPEGQAARDRLRTATQTIRSRIWPASGQGPGGLQTVETDVGMGLVLGEIERLQPATESGQARKKQALQAFEDLVQAQLGTIEQAQLELPPALLVVLIAWLTILFTCLGVLCPRNTTAVGALTVSALAMAVAIFLLMELSHPFDGLIQVPHAPLDKAIELMQRVIER